MSHFLRNGGSLKLKYLIQITCKMRKVKETMGYTLCLKIMVIVKSAMHDHFLFGRVSLLIDSSLFCSITSQVEQENPCFFFSNWFKR